MKVLLSLVLFLFFSIGCGGDDDDNDGYSAPPPPPPPTPAEEAFLAAKPTIEKSCGGGKCHTSGTLRDNVIKSSANFLASKACVFVAQQTMPKVGSPQAGAITEEERQIILGLCEG